MKDFRNGLTFELFLPPVMTFNQYMLSSVQKRKRQGASSAIPLFTIILVPKIVGVGSNQNPPPTAPGGLGWENSLGGDGLTIFNTMTKYFKDVK